MTEPLHTRAAEIIAAYGANPVRWPDAERTTVLAVIAASPDLCVAQAAAATLDADLFAWAISPVAPGDAAAAAARATRRSPPYLRWAGGTGLAAAVTAGFIVFAPAHRAPPVTTIATATATTDTTTAFAQVFTPTPDEEQVL